MIILSNEYYKQEEWVFPISKNGKEENQILDSPGATIIVSKITQQCNSNGRFKIILSKIGSSKINTKGRQNLRNVSRTLICTLYVKIVKLYSRLQNKIQLLFKILQSFCYSILQ